MNKQTSTKQPLTVGEASKAWLFSEGQPVSPRPEPLLNCHDGTVTPLLYPWHPSWMRRKTNKGEEVLFEALPFSRTSLG